jgi:hypothetical protein
MTAESTRLSLAVAGDALLLSGADSRFVAAMLAALLTPSMMSMQPKN